MAVCRIRLEPAEMAPYGRLHLRRSGLGDSSLVAALADAATPLRHVELESVELHDLYALAVADGADDVAVRRLFDPVVIGWLNERHHRRRGGRPLRTPRGRHLLRPGDGVVRQVLATTGGVVTLELVGDRALAEGDLAAPARLRA